MDAAFPDGSSARYFYDELGNRTLSQFGDRRSVTYEHDAAGGLASVKSTEGDGTVRVGTVSPRADLVERIEHGLAGQWGVFDAGQKSLPVDNPVSRALALTSGESSWFDLRGHTDVQRLTDVASDNRLAVLMGDSGLRHQADHGPEFVEGLYPDGRIRVVRIAPPTPCRSVDGQCKCTTDHRVHDGWRVIPRRRSTRAQPTSTNTSTRRPGAARGHACPDHATLTTHTETTATCTCDEDYSDDPDVDGLQCVADADDAVSCGPDETGTPPDCMKCGKDSVAKLDILAVLDRSRGRRMSTSLAPRVERRTEGPLRGFRVGELAGDLPVRGRRGG